MEIFKFTYSSDYGYHCNKFGDQDGEYVRLAAYEELQAENKRLQLLADATLLFADEFGLDSWVVDAESEGRTDTPEQKLDAAITAYKKA